MDLRLTSDAVGPLSNLLNAWAGEGLSDDGAAARAEMNRRWPSLAKALYELTQAVVPVTAPHTWVDHPGTPATGGRPTRGCALCDRVEFLNGQPLRRGYLAAPCREMNDRYATGRQP